MNSIFFRRPARGTELSDLRQSLHQEPPLGLLPSKFEGTFVGRSGRIAAAEPAEQVGARRMGEVIFRQLASGEDGVDQLEPSCRPLPHGYGDRPIQLDHRRWVDREERVIQRRDPPPVSRFGARGTRMDGGNGRLDGVGPEPPGAPGPLD